MTDWRTNADAVRAVLADQRAVSAPTATDEEYLASQGYELVEGLTERLAARRVAARARHRDEILLARSLVPVEVPA